jgi:N-formylglutamate amidohydrolase
LLARPSDTRLAEPGQKNGRGTYITGMIFMRARHLYGQQFDTPAPAWVNRCDVHTARSALEWAMKRGRLLPAEPPGGPLPSLIGDWDYPFPNPDAWPEDDPPGGWTAGAGRRRLVLHIPHASREIPPFLRDTLLVDDETLATELRLMTDADTDTLFPVTAYEAERVVAQVSRLVVDMERHPLDRDEAMARCGMGAIYTRTHQGMRLRHAPGEAERAGLMDHWYWQHHDALSMAIGRVAQRFGSAVLVDCHSFSSRPLPHEPCQELDRPDICIGTDLQRTPRGLIRAIQGFCGNQGVTTAVDTPFCGVLIPPPFVDDQRLSAVMIEVNRRLYLDEATGTPGPGFAATQRFLARLLRCIEGNAAP